MNLGGTMLNKSDRERKIPYNLTCTWNIKNKINEQTKQTQTYRYRQHFDGIRQQGVGEMGKKEEGTKKYELVVIKLSWNIKYSLGNIVSNIITMYGVRWDQIYQGDHFID